LALEQKLKNLRFLTQKNKLLLRWYNFMKIKKKINLKDEKISSIFARKYIYYYYGFIWLLLILYLFVK